MGVSTIGKIKGYVSADEIYNFIRQKYDESVQNHTRKTIYDPISKITWKHTINEHSEDNEHWYDIGGFITFKYNNRDRSLFYMYNNINSFEELNKYRDTLLEEMVKSETTHISLGCDSDAVYIMKDIISHFGGWIDENDCDDKDYYYIPKNTDLSITPIKYVTMEEIYEKFGGVVVIKK